jgi:hypothetical protein
MDHSGSGTPPLIRALIADDHLVVRELVRLDRLHPDPGRARAVPLEARRASGRPVSRLLLQPVRLAHMTQKHRRSSSVIVVKRELMSTRARTTRMNAHFPGFVDRLRLPGFGHQRRDRNSVL